MGSVLPAILAGSFALAGGLLGAILTGYFNLVVNKKKQTDEDERRWLVDRRQAFAGYLSLCESMLREIDSFAIFMSYDGKKAPKDGDLEFIPDGHFDYMSKWDDELQPALFEVQLMASPAVADLADRVSGALMELTDYVGVDKLFVDYYPVWFQARDMIQVLRNSMRTELGLLQLENSSFPRAADWPWLPDRPPRESYRQQHSIHPQSD
jgi:hypothetical protein